MANKINAKAQTPMTEQEVSEKFNGGKKIIDFVGKKKIFFGISIGIIVLGIIFNFIFGTRLDIQFSGGATLTFSYTGEVDQNSLYDFIQDPDNNFVCLEASSVDASMGFMFLLKCLAAVALASILMVIYVTIRFKKIGGLSAGVMALVALFHDVAMIYFMYVIFQMPIDSNFIAVVLMIIGYSLNDTIVIYDRVREQRRLMGRSTDIGTIFNVSCTKTIKRTIMTSVTTFAAILIVYIVATVFNIASVKGFALPMMIGVISGCYSSICIAGPLWVMWQNHKEAKK